MDIRIHTVQSELKTCNEFKKKCTITRSLVECSRRSGTTGVHTSGQDTSQSQTTGHPTSFAQWRHWASVVEIKQS